MSPEISSPEPCDQPFSPKRKAGDAGLNVNANGRPVKRRASKACQCCRARKVRCNVVEHGAPCTNCRLDEVPCIVTESKRRKKHAYTAALKPSDGNGHSHAHLHVGLSGAEALKHGSVNPCDITNPAFRSSSDSVSSANDGDEDQNLNFHVPHALYQTKTQQLNGIEASRQQRTGSFTPFSGVPVYNLINVASMHGDLVSNQVRNPAAPTPKPEGPLPAYIKPLPQRMAADDITHLWKKGALAIPETAFRDELLRSYIEFVHPYMPLIELHDFLRIVDKGTGEDGRISLLLFQAVMFTGIAFVDMSWLTAAGFATRKAARKAFYLKARALYDFDYEYDRVAIVQSLLLMTYWYETPDDQKDTWHWMGVAISLAHTIGLHRNPSNSTMEPKKQRLWKRIWWSCFMRDRLVALGMRRPTRIKDEDFDVPMLTLDDFEIETLSADNLTISQDCKMIRSIPMQKELALLCIAKAKLCLCISHVLTAQYSVLVRDQGTAVGQEGNTRSSVMLFPKKHDQTDEVKICDTELADWIQSLPPSCVYRSPESEDLANGASTVVVQRALLHMVYYATLSALHRPQVLPSAETASLQKCRELQDVSRKKVREASREITRMSQEIHKLGLTGYLPTTGVTVLLPAIIIHLLDIKSFSDATREEALQGFCQCMQVLEKLRDNYAAADFATQFLEAAIRKADIDVSSSLNSSSKSSSGNANGAGSGGVFRPQYPQQKRIIQNVSQLIDAGLSLSRSRAARLTPPPDPLDADTDGGSVGYSIPVSNHGLSLGSPMMGLGGIGDATTPPGSDGFSASSAHEMSHDHASTASPMASSSLPGLARQHHQPLSGDGGANADGAAWDHHAHASIMHAGHADFDEAAAFDSLINFDGAVSGGLAGGAAGADALDGLNAWPGLQMEDHLHGESGGFMMDIDWMGMGGMKEGGEYGWGGDGGHGEVGGNTYVGSGSPGMAAGSPGPQQAQHHNQNDGHNEAKLAPEEQALFLLREGVGA